MANNLTYFDMLAEHSPVNSENYAAVFLFCYRNLRIGVKISENIIFCCFCNSIFRQCKYIAYKFSSVRYGVAISYSTQRET